MGSSHRLTESLLDPLVLIILPEARGLVSVHRVPHKEEEIDPMCHTDPVNSGLKLVVAVEVGGGSNCSFLFHGNQCVCGWYENTCSKVQVIFKATDPNVHNVLVLHFKKPA